MRPTIIRRTVVALMAIALIVSMGAQGMQAAAMATMGTDTPISLTAPMDNASGLCTNCEGPQKGGAMQCQTVSVCAPSIAVLAMAELILRKSTAVRFEAEAMSFEGRTGTPEPHPPKSAALL